MSKVALCFIHRSSHSFRFVHVDGNKAYHYQCSLRLVVQLLQHYNGNIQCEHLQVVLLLLDTAAVMLE